MMHLKVTVALTAAFALLPQCLSSEEEGPFAPAPAPSPPLECSEVRNAFDARGIRVDWSAIPKGPMNGKLVGRPQPLRKHSAANVDKDMDKDTHYRVPSYSALFYDSGC